MTDVTSDNYGKYLYTFTVYGGPTYTVGIYAASGAYTKNAYYIVVPAGDNSSAGSFLSVTAPKTVVGKVTGSGTNYYKVDSVKYMTGIAPEEIDTAIDYNATTFTFYLDSTGAIAGYAEKTAATTTYDGYLYLSAYQSKVTEEASALIDPTSFSAVAKAKVNFTDGSAAQAINLAVYVDTASDGTKTAYLGTSTSGTLLPAGSNNELLDAGWYQYKKTDSGYILAAADTTKTTVTLYAGAAAIIDGKYADAATVVTVYNYDSTKAIATSTAYTGIAGYPSTSKTYTNAAAVTVYDTTYTNLVKTCDVFTGVASTTSVTYAYYVGEGETYDTDLKYQKFYVKGDTVEYKFSGDALSLTEGHVYTITLDSNGKLKTASDCNAASGKITYIGSTYITLDNGAPIYLTSTFAAYNCTSTGDGSAVTLAVGDTIAYVLSSAKMAVAYTVDAD